MDNVLVSYPSPYSGSTPLQELVYSLRACCTVSCRNLLYCQRTLVLQGHQHSMLLAPTGLGVSPSLPACDSRCVPQNLWAEPVQCSAERIAAFWLSQSRIRIAVKRQEWDLQLCWQQQQCCYDLSTCGTSARRPGRDIPSLHLFSASAAGFGPQSCILVIFSGGCGRLTKTKRRSPSASSRTCV